MSAFIPQMEPLIAEADREAVAAYLRSGGWLTEFKETRAFESALRDYTGASHCVAAPSGTLALFLAVKACGIGAGDEVIVPDLTMAASATAVTLAGATVVFADIEPRTLCLDLDAAEQRITDRTRAVMFVSLNGRAPSSLPAFIDRCRGGGIRVIEDAAQSLGSFLGGRHLGTLGDCGCLSFSSQKIVTTGQGGAVITNDASLMRAMHLLRDFGRLEGGSDHYLSVGWNLKFTDLQAVVGASQMRRLPEIVKRKRAIFERYRDQLAGVSGIQFVATDLSTTTPWFIDVLVNASAKPALIDHLRTSGVGSRAFYPPLHAEPAFSRGGSYPVASDVSARGLWLPSSVSLADPDIDCVCEAIRGFIEG